MDQYRKYLTGVEFIIARFIGVLLPGYSPVISAMTFNKHNVFNFTFLMVFLGITDYLMSDLGTTLWNLAGFMSVFLLGYYVFLKNKSVSPTTGFFLVGASSLLFFLITNLGFCVRYFGITPDNLIACYYMGLPFLFKSLMGNYAYVAVLASLNFLAVRLRTS